MCISWTIKGLVVFNIKERTQAEGFQKQGAVTPPVMPIYYWHNGREVRQTGEHQHEERNDLYRSPTIIREMGATRCMNGGEKCTYGFVESPVGNRPLPRPSGRWENTIKMYLKEIGRKCLNWIREAQK